MITKNIILFIQSRKEDQILFTKHAFIRIQEREINKETIIYYLKFKKPFQIKFSYEYVYKLWYQYNIYEDLTIVVSLELNLIVVITIIREGKSENEK